MPSVSLRHWQNDRRPRLEETAAHCAVAAATLAPTLFLAEESLRGYVMLLSGHFQGFCRDLYTECAQVFATHQPASIQATVQGQFFAELKLNSNNPTVETIRKDFDRFGFALNLAADPANAPRVTHLGQLNKWRNAVAHQKATAPPGLAPLALADVRTWQVSCAELATWLDGIMYNQMQHILGVAPW